MSESYEMFFKEVTKMHHGRLETEDDTSG